MKYGTEEVLSIIFSIIAMLIGMIFYYYLSNYIMSAILIIEAIFLAILFKRKYNTFLNSCSIFSAIWFLTIGLATLKLHQLQQPWKIVTFLYLEMAYVAFIIGYMFKFGNKVKAKAKKNKITKKEFLIFLSLFFLIILIAFILEVIINGYIPIFSEDMASYQDFSVTGIHYFTVSCCLMLPLTYIFIKFFETSVIEKIYLIFVNIICLAIPVLIVSRQLLIMTVILTAFAYMYFNPKKEIKLIIVTVLGVFIVWTFVGNFRNQNEQYLKQALQIQTDTKLSVENMQLYMYIAFNYDNFNANVGEIHNYTLGLKSIFPVLALTGIKFFIPKNSDDDLIRIVDVYNTYPIIMTPYEDFGGLGIFFYMLIVGMICSKFDKLSGDNPINILLKLLVKYSLLFSFFVSYFSNPTMWFYVIFLLICKMIFFKNKILVKKGDVIYNEKS